MPPATSEQKSASASHSDRLDLARSPRPEVDALGSVAIGLLLVDRAHLAREMKPLLTASRPQRHLDLDKINVRSTRPMFWSIIHLRTMHPRS